MASVAGVVGSPAATSDASRAVTLARWLADSLPASRRRLRVLNHDGSVDEAPWPDVYRRAVCRAAGLQQSGIGPGDRLAVLGPTTAPLVETLLAVWLTGATPLVLPLPLRFRSAGSFVEGTRARMREIDARVMLFDPRLGDVAGAVASDRRVEELTAEPPTDLSADPVAVDPSATAILQFTSGSTARPRAVAVSHRAVTACVRAMGDAVAFGADDTWVSWLPLYHDMGLVGALLFPTLFGAAVTLMPTDMFVGSPDLWMRAVSADRGTVTAAPNFAYGLAARLMDRSGPLDLSSLRVAFCGAEPVIPATMAEFAREGEAHKLRPGVVLPCYGLAEATLAVSFAPVGRPVVVDVVDRTQLHEHRVARPLPLDGGPGDAIDTTEVVALGLPLRGTALRIVGPEGTELGEREVGEVHVASPSLMDGYLHETDSTVATTGWLPTGDLGYMAGGELHICGRIKDLIIVSGHNIHPHEVEAAAELAPGVRQGGTVAFARDGGPVGEEIVVLCETRAEADQHADIVAEVRRRVAQAVGVAPGHVGLLEPHRVPKTTSGKRQRNVARRLFLSGELAPFAAPVPAAQLPIPRRTRR